MSDVRRVALFGFLGSGNIGNDASLETVLRWLGDLDPDLDLRCVTLAPESVEERYGIRSEPLSSYRERAGDGALATLARKLVARWRDAVRTWRLAGSTDAIVVPGMGVLEDTLGIRPLGLPSWLLLLALSCRARGSRLVLLGIGAEPAPWRLSRHPYAVVADLAHHISYRDQWSALAMRKVGARKTDVVAADLVFAHPLRPAWKPVPGVVVIGVMAYYGRKDNPVVGAEVRRCYVRTMVDVVRGLVAAGDGVVLVGGDDVDVAVACEIQDSLADEFRHAVRVSRAQTFAELSEQVSRAEVVVAARFHNLICAFRLGVPVISLGYAAKSSRLMAQAGMGEYAHDLDDVLHGQVTPSAVDGAVSGSEHGGATLLLSQIDRVRGAVSEVRPAMMAATVENRRRVEKLLDEVARYDLGLAPAASTPTPASRSPRSACDRDRAGADLRPPPPTALDL